MSDDRWRRLERIYHAALEMSSSERSAFVRAEAGGDLELAAEIEALLQFDERPAAFTRHSAMELVVRSLAQTAARAPQEHRGTIGSYEVVRLLGAGGMGNVYLARDSRLARYAAVKMVRPDFVDAAWIAAFRHEALAASGLNHPNILTIYEIGEQDGMSFIAAEYVDGIALRERLKAGSLPLAEVVDIGIQIGEGLAAAHEKGVVHRDIKPDNVMLRADGLVKILDFGIATRTDVAAPLQPTGLTDGVVIGTSGYMSPEQRQGLPVDARTDVWSLGIVISEMATGRLPEAVTTIRQDDGMAVQNAVAHDALAQVSAELARIVGRALSREAADRYATAGELVRDLRALRRSLEAVSADVVPTGRHAGRRRAGGLPALVGLGAAALALVALAGYLVLVAGRNSDARAVRSIGIMPLRSGGQISEGADLADGIAASLRSRLTRFSSIRQAAASEAARYERLGASPADAGREMGVDAVVSGSVERRGDTVIVRLSLHRSADGLPLWMRQFVRPMDDVLTLQTEITRELTDALGISPRAFRDHDETRDPRAYQLYAKGRYHVQRRTPDDLRKGLEYLREAAGLDPGYGRAHAELADAYILLAMTSDVAPKEAFPRARAAAERALAIDSGLSDARTSMGIIKFWFDWDWTGAEAEFRRAIESERPDPAAHTFYGHLLSNLGDHTGALQQMRRALDYEPHSALANALFAQCMYYEGRHDDSLAHFRRTLELDPTLWLTHNMMGRIYGRLGMYREALQAFDRATELGGSLVVRAMAGYTLAVIGRQVEARRILEQLQRRAARAYVPPSNLALVHLGLGEHELALDQLEKGLDTRDMLLTFLTAEPRWKDLAGHPRFDAVLTKVGLKP